MNFSAMIAAPDSSMREKSFIGREGKLNAVRRFCNLWNDAPRMFLEELNTGQLSGAGRSFLRKCRATVVPLLGGPDREKPAGAGWLMNKVNFVAAGGGLEGDFEDEVKMRAGCGRLPGRSGEKAR